MANSLNGYEIRRAWSPTHKERGQEHFRNLLTSQVDLVAGARFELATFGL